METWHPTGLVPLGWGAWTNPKHWSGFRVEREEDVTREGAVGLKVRAETFCNVFSGATVKPEEKYTLSAWVRAEKRARVLVKLSIQGTDVPSGERERIRRSWDVKPGQWMRVHATGVTPKGAERATTYFCLPAGNVYLLDAAMLNEGDLMPYVDGPRLHRIVPLGGKPSKEEVAFVPHSYDEGGRIIDDPGVALAFDSDILSFAKRLLPSHRLPKTLGAELSRPAVLRGLSVLFDKPGLPESVTVTVQVLRSTRWQTVPHRPIPVGCATLLAIEPEQVDGIRLRLVSSDGLEKPCPKIAHIGLMQ
jgi:hypothetical protein